MRSAVIDPCCLYFEKTKSERCKMQDFQMERLGAERGERKRTIATLDQDATALRVRLRLRGDFFGWVRTF